MSGDSVDWDSPILRRLLGPSTRILDVEDRRGARLLAALEIAHLMATVLGTAAASVFRWHWVKRGIASTNLLLTKPEIDCWQFVQLLMLAKHLQEHRPTYWGFYYRPTNRYNHKRRKVL